MPYDWILFDADNTLFDFDLSAEKSLEKTIRDFDIEYQPMHQDIYEKINKKCWKDFEDGLLPQSKLRDLRFELFLKAINEPADVVKMSSYYLKCLSETDYMLNGARELLNRLEGKIKMALVTNGLKEVQRPRITKAKLTHYFETIVVSDEIGVAKPNIAFYDYTFEQINWPDKNKVLKIGDSLNSDIQGGINYGLDTCWYNPHKKENKTQFIPTYEIHDLNQIDDLVFLSEIK